MEIRAGQTIVLNSAFPGWARLLAGAGGLFAIWIITRELGPAFTSFGWYTVFFGVIAIGGSAMGALFLLAGLFGESASWTITEDELRIETRTPFARRLHSAKRGDLVETSIREHEWDSRATTFSVAIKLASGAAFDSPDFADIERAQSLAAELRRRFVSA